MVWAPVSVSGRNEFRALIDTSAMQIQASRVFWYVEFSPTNSMAFAIGKLTSVLDISIKLSTLGFVITVNSQSDFLGVVHPGHRHRWTQSGLVLLPVELILR